MPSALTKSSMPCRPPSSTRVIKYLFISWMWMLVDRLFCFLSSALRCAILFLNAKIEVQYVQPLYFLPSDSELVISVYLSMPVAGESRARAGEPFEFIKCGHADIGRRPGARRPAAAARLCLLMGKKPNDQRTQDKEFG